MSEPNIFADLIPTGTASGENAFADLIPEQNAFADLIPPKPSRPQAQIDERRRQLERERELVLEQERMEAEQAQLTPGKVALRAGLGVGQAGGIIEEQAGAITASPLYDTVNKLTPLYEPIRRLARGLLPDDRKETGRRMLARGKQRKEDYSELGEAVGGGPVADITQTVTATGAASLPVIPAALFGGLPAAAVVAGTQQFGSTYADALPVMGEKKAFGPALVSGLVTGLVTGAFGKISGGFEDLTLGAIKAAGMRSLADNLRLLTARAAGEGVEETTDQALQSLISKWSYRPELTLKQALEETLQAGGIGTLLGFGTGGAGVAVGKLDEISTLRKEDKDFQQRSIMAAQRAATLFSDPSFHGDPRMRRVRQAIEKQILTPEIQDALRKQSTGSEVAPAQTETLPAVGADVRPAEVQPAGAPAPEAQPAAPVPAPVSAGQAVAPDAVPTLPTSPSIEGSSPSVAPTSPSIAPAAVPPLPTLDYAKKHWKVRRAPNQQFHVEDEKGKYLGTEDYRNNAIERLHGTLTRRAAQQAPAEPPVPPTVAIPATVQPAPADVGGSDVEVPGHNITRLRGVEETPGNENQEGSA